MQRLSPQVIGFQDPQCPSSHFSNWDRPSIADILPETADNPTKNSQNGTSPDYATKEADLQTDEGGDQGGESTKALSYSQVQLGGSQFR